MVERKSRHRRGQGIGIVALARSRTRIATVGFMRPLDMWNLTGRVYQNIL